MAILRHPCSPRRRRNPAQYSSTPVLRLKTTLRQSLLSLTPAMRDLRLAQPPAHRAYGPEGGPGFISRINQAEYFSHLTSLYLTGLFSINACISSSSGSFISLNIRVWKKSKVSIFNSSSKESIVWPSFLNNL